jgi:hypothetical protein
LRKKACRKNTVKGTAYAAYTRIRPGYVPSSPNCCTTKNRGTRARKTGKNIAATKV